MSKIRKLKVYTKYQKRKFGEAKIPEIRLEGKWLYELGFKAGKTIKIKQENNKLTIIIDDKII